MCARFEDLLFHGVFGVAGSAASLALPGVKEEGEMDMLFL